MLSNISMLSVPDEGYSRNVPDEGYSSNVPDEGYSSNVPDEGYSRNASCALNFISIHFKISMRIYSKLSNFTRKANINYEIMLFNNGLLRPCFRLCLIFIWINGSNQIWKTVLVPTTWRKRLCGICPGIFFQ